MRNPRRWSYGHYDCRWIIIVYGVYYSLLVLVIVFLIEITARSAGKRANILKWLQTNITKPFIDTGYCLLPNNVVANKLCLTFRVGDSSSLRRGEGGHLHPATGIRKRLETLSRAFEILGRGNKGGCITTQRRTQEHIIASLTDDNGEGKAK